MSFNRDRLSDHIHLLGDVLGQTIIEQEGQPLFDLVEQVRGLAKAHRGGDEAAGERLLRRVEALPLPEARGVVKAFAAYFQLVNLAEDQERVRVLRRRERDAHASGESAIETMGAAVAELKACGLSFEELQKLLDRLLVMPVFTAHPTEAKRRTILTKLAAIAGILHRLDYGRPGPEEERQAHEELREEIVSLWQTDETRADKPDVMDEVRNGLFYFETRALRPAARRSYRALERALAEHYPGPRVDSALPPLRQLDGRRPRRQPVRHPAVTEETLRAHNEVALRLLRRGHRAPARPPQHQRAAAAWSPSCWSRIEADERLFPEDAQRAQDALRRPALPTEAALRLPQARRDARGQHPALARRPPRAPRRLRRRAICWPTCGCCRRACAATAASAWPTGRLATLVRQAEIFGFHLATLDLRQHSGRHASALDEVLARYGLAARYAAGREDERARAADRRDPRRPAARPAPPRLQRRDERDDRAAPARAQGARAHRPRRGRQLRHQHDPRPERLLAVLLLARDAGVADRLDIVPLFETVADLHAAPAIMAACSRTRPTRGT